MMTTVGWDIQHSRGRVELSRAPAQHVSVPAGLEPSVQYRYNNTDVCTATAETKGSNTCTGSTTFVTTTQLSYLVILQVMVGDGWWWWWWLVMVCDGWWWLMMVGDGWWWLVMVWWCHGVFWFVSLTEIDSKLRSAHCQNIEVQGLPWYRVPAVSRAALF